jgi:hypothetical protein
MKFIGSATVALIILLIVDEALNDERFTRATIVAIRQALASMGIHFWVLRQVPRWRANPLPRRYGDSAAALIST